MAKDKGFIVKDERKIGDYEKCSTCKYGTIVNEGDDTVFCLRYPPRDQLFAVTKADWWCGEFYPEYE